MMMTLSLLISQDWEQSFNAGDFDANGLFIGGSEVLHLVSHKNKLFASIGYWQDESNIWYGGDDLSIGWSQVIYLENEDDNWQVDFDLGYNYLRPEILKQVIFTKDYTGTQLSSPDTLLIVGAFSPNYISGTVTANIFIRDDQYDSWTQISVYEGDFDSDESYSMRDIEIYMDQVTGIENLIVSVGTQGIFSGKYNPEIDGKIEMGIFPEIGPLGTRSLGITTANNQLYFSSGSKIFKRNDGLEPNYEVVHNFNDLSSYVNPAVGGVRGLSAVPNPSGQNESLILMWCPDGQSKGIIFRLDPLETQEFDRVYETKISLLVEDYLPGETVNYLLGAYNEFYSYTDPLTNVQYTMIGVESLIQENIYPSWNSYYSGGIVFMRSNEGQYSIQEVNGAIDFNDDPLVSVRCYVSSPFENETAMYFGGFDPNGHTSTNNAWIYKKNWNTLDLDLQDSNSAFHYNLKNNYPNPFNPSTNISYSLSIENFITIAVYDLIGNKVKILVSDYKDIGNYTVNWNGVNEKGVSVPAGLYLFSIEVDEFRQTKKMILLK